jgi:acyl-CoA reductase-like NAD-dependent aldehyde dehydrogenase
MATTSRSFPRLQVSCLEGRAQSTRFKQAQFHSLHETLKKSSDAIKAAIAADSGHTPREVDFEFSLALSELRLHYDSLNLVTELANSLKIESDLENIDRVRPVGMVYILPQKQNLFYSVISPLGAAVAAGNCVVLEVS